MQLGSQAPLQLRIQHRLRIKALRLKLEAVASFRRWAKSNVSCLKELAKRAERRGMTDAARSLHAQAFAAGTQVQVTRDMLRCYNAQLTREYRRWHRCRRKLDGN